MSGKALRCRPTHIFKIPFMRRFKKLLIVCSFLPLSMVAQADELNEYNKDGKTEPVLQGYVSDGSTKKPVKGVTISVRSAKGDKEFVTDANGSFKIPQISSGEVTIVLEKKGYKTYRREGVLLKEGISIRLNFDLYTEEMEDDTDVFHPLLRMMDGE